MIADVAISWTEGNAFFIVDQPLAHLGAPHFPVESTSQMWAIVPSPLVVLLIADHPLANLATPHFARGIKLSGVSNRSEFIGSLASS